MERFSFEGNDYLDLGDVIYNASREPVLTVSESPSGRYWHVETMDGWFSAIDKGQPDARMVCIRAALSSLAMYA